MRELGAVARWKDATLEAQLSCFFDAGFSLRDAANFPGQTHFAEKDRPWIDNFFLVTRSNGSDDAEIDSRLVDVDTAGDVDKNILVEEPGAHFFLKTATSNATRL